MEIVVVGLNHRTSPIEIREKLSFNDHQLREGLGHLKCYPGIQEGIILSTCNRVEIYVVSSDAAAGFEQVQQFLLNHAARHGEAVSPKSITDGIYLYSNQEAIRHVLRVVSSLDSMMVGEPQILGQVKEAFEIALHQKASGQILNNIFKKAISVAKRIRTETAIAQNAVSISFAAVELAKKIFGNLAGKNVLLLGAGEMAELAVRHLKNAGIGNLLITTRTYHNAVALAKDFDGFPLPFEEFPRELEKTDIVICSTGAVHHVVRPEHLAKAIDRRKNKPIFLIDISVPRNIDPEVNRIDNIYLYDIDDLQSVVDANLKERHREALKAEEIVSEEILSIQRWLKSLEVVPMITALRKRADDIRTGELERYRTRLNQLKSEERELIEAITSGIVNKLLHAPQVVLKSEANSSNGSLYIEAATRLFRLDQETELETPSDESSRDSSKLKK